MINPIEIARKAEAFAIVAMVWPQLMLEGISEKDLKEHGKEISQQICGELMELSLKEFGEGND